MAKMPPVGPKGNRYVLPTVCLLLVAVSIGVAVYYYRQVVALRQNPQQTAQDAVAEVVAKVSQIMVLPQGEQPILATVADPSKLKDQPFFAQAKIGDKVLLYTNARKAILYDPVANKIVEVAPINLGNTGGSAQ